MIYTLKYLYSATNVAQAVVCAIFLFVLVVPLHGYAAASQNPIVEQQTESHSALSQEEIASRDDIASLNPYAYQEKAPVSSLATPLFLGIIIACFLFGFVFVFGSSTLTRPLSFYMRTLGAVLFIAGGITTGSVAYRAITFHEAPVVFSPRFMLASLWRDYKSHYWDDAIGRVTDEKGNTTSEAQSYTLLRAVWLDDKETFDKTWNWMSSRLMHDDNYLFSWLYGARANGTQGIIFEKGGGNAASDADTDTALSLIFAYSRWHEARYLQMAQAIIDDIWNYEVVTIRGKPYLAANDIERLSPNRIIVNPSYFAPYAYRIFGELDTRHDWEALVQSSYDVIEQASVQMSRGEYVGIPLDWIVIDRRTGEFSALPPTLKSSSTAMSYGYDAMRIPWRLALDSQWFHEPRAKKALEEHFAFLERTWSEKRVLGTVYGMDGAVINGDEAPSMYGGSIGYFAVIDPVRAREIYETKLASLYNPDIYGWRSPMSYYDDNWAWFGIGLYNGELMNLADNETLQKMPRSQTAVINK